MASPRWITAAEVTTDEAGDVQGPTSATDGNLAVFDGTTGKLIKDGGPVPGGGGLSVKVIDLGLVDLKDAAINGRSVPLIAAAAGKVIKSVRFIPGGEAFMDINAAIYFVTPNTGTDPQFERAGFAFIPEDRGSARDTLGLISASSYTGLDGTSNGRAQIQDCGPLFAVNNTATKPGVPIGTWQAETIYSAGDLILDDADHIQSVNDGGVSGSSEPTWDDEGGTTSDGTVVWQDVGLIPTGSVHVTAEVIEGISPMPLYPASIEFVAQPQDTEAEATMADITVLVKDQNGDPYTLTPVTIVLVVVGVVGVNEASAITDIETGIATFSGLSIVAPGTNLVMRARTNPLLVANPVLSAPFDITAP